MSSHSDSDGMGSIPASSDAQNVPLLLCQERFNEASLSESNYLFGPLGRFESHIPENIVDQMDNVLVQEILFLDNQAPRRASEKAKQKKRTTQPNSAMRRTGLTCPLEQPSACQGSFHQRDAIYACRST